MAVEGLKMRNALIIMCLLVSASLLSGCELIAAGVIGAEIERHHRELEQWCHLRPGQPPPYDADWWRRCSELAAHGDYGLRKHWH
jgi:hypothetical protein